MKIKQILGFIIAVILLYSISAITLSFKKNEHLKGNSIPTVTEDDPVYYWFYLKIRIDDRTNTFKVSGTSGGLDYGYQLDFEKALWNNLSKRQIAIGPFQTKEEALNAKRLYKMSEDKIHELPEGEVPDRINWFAITFEQSPRLKIYIIRRAPGAVQTGTEDFFVSTFYEQLGVRLLSIGPFYDYEHAEMAKRLYRMNE